MYISRIISDNTNSEAMAKVALIFLVSLFCGSVEVFCDQTTDTGEWTVIQRRQDGSVDFYRGWSEYERGFGDPTGEFWLGLSNIHRLTNSGNYSLRVDLEDWDGSTAYAVYNSFRIEGASDNYRLRISGYHGTAGDSITLAIQNLNNQQFTTYDRDHDLDIYWNCAITWHGAWWYNKCTVSNLNGLYYTDPSVRTYKGVEWYYWKHDGRSYKRAEMKIRPQPLDLNGATSSSSADVFHSPVTSAASTTNARQTRALSVYSHSHGAASTACTMSVWLAMCLSRVFVQPT